MPVDQKTELPRRRRISGLKLRMLTAPRNILFGALIAASAGIFFEPLRNLFALCQSSDEFSYIALIPLIVLGLLYVNRVKVFHTVQYSTAAGIALILAGIATAVAGMIIFSGSSKTDIRLFLEILGLVGIWSGHFVWCYGVKAARAGIFELLFTLLLVPLPHRIIDAPIELVRYGSTDVTSALFTLFGIPFFRDGLTFSLPRLRFVVAQECSGIHSTTALFIAAVLVSHFYLERGWVKGLLVALIFPIVCFTNGLRMFILAVLAVYVNPAFFHGNLHHKGGALFFVLGLVILFLIAKLLRRSSHASSAATTSRRGGHRRRSAPLADGIGADPSGQAST